TQVVQDLPGHSAPLVAGKTTVVRVYLGTDSATLVKVRASLHVRRNATGSTWIQVPSAGPVSLVAAENGQLRAMRENLGNSLVFELPLAATAAGSWVVALSRVERVTPPVAAIPLPPS